MRSLLLISVLTLTAGCATAVRDPHVYKQELSFLAALAAKLSDQQLEAAAAAARAGDDVRCAHLAEDALVARVRAPYHVAMALALADLGKDPGEPPAIPPANAWCSAQSIGGAQ